MKDEIEVAQEPMSAERLVTIGEAAHTLGLSVRAVYRLVAAGELPAPLKIGRASRMAITEIHAYIGRLKQQRRP